MTDLGVLQERRLRRAELAAQARRARRRRRARYCLLIVGLGIATLLAFMAQGASDPASRPARTAARNGGTAAATPTRTPAARAGYGASFATTRVNARFKLPMASGILFDVHTGRVLWARDPQRLLPIASLTKMMTALVVVAHAPPGARVLVTRAAVHFSGSGVGLLPLGKWVRLETMLYGLMLPSGNDAAIALAQRIGGGEGRFIAMMNARARDMGLRCTHFTSDSGIVDQGNYSCATDLAIMAHAVLDQPRLARIVASRSAVLPFPIKGGKLWLYNNNPLLRLGYPGADGVKTGYTVAAGPCLVASAHRGGRWLGVVILHSDDPYDQAKRLLDAGFATPGA
jgi:D-alanyl-D-alanine carboxypeptidase (penicillin-binding protein 5/6)